MDDLLREFVTETNESLDVVDVELVRFEREPGNATIINNVFRLVHTIKGTCGFLGLPRLEALAHAAEALMGRFRDGVPATTDAVSLILATIDRIKQILEALEHEQREPDGADDDLISGLTCMAEGLDPKKPAQPQQQAVGTLVEQVLERPLLPGEDSLDDLERAFRATPVDPPQRRAKSPLAGAVKDDDQKNGNQSIRVSVETLERLMTMVSELVLTRNQLLEIGRRHEESEFKTPLQRLSNVTAELQEGVMKTRMQPIGNAWQKLPRIVRDLCNELGKQIDLEMQGAETELDRQVLDLIKDPLTHMLRNSADHGLETPEERRAAGKPERGRIRLSAWHEGGFIVIQIADAGRGVGMDVVRSNIDQIGGTIDVRSVPGVGVSFTVKIPLTLAIVSALIVEAGGDRYAIPQLAVIELVRAHGGSEHRIERIKDTAVLRLRDKLLPVARLSRLLGIAPSASENVEQGFIVVTQVGAQTFGIVVDAVFHTEEIVVKPMSSKLRHIALFCGNTILGDGSVIMIIDPNGIAQALGTTAAAQLQLQAAAAADAEASASA